MADPTYTIVTTMKNEGPFILEWIAYHRAIGFTNFVVFTNDCDDGTDKIIMRLEELGLAHHVHNKLKAGQSPQRTALRRSQWNEVAQASDWLMCADVDEFLMIRTGNGTMHDLMAAVGEVDAISFCWKLFGNGGRTAFEPGFVTEQFKWAAPEDRFPHFRASGMKTLMKNNEKFVRLRIHRPLIEKEAEDVAWVDAGGQPMPDAYRDAKWSAHKEFSHEFARLHHYAVRSVDSFLVKRDRGRTNHVNGDQGMDYWQSMNSNFEYDDAIETRLPAARQLFEDYMADPELAALHQTACSWHSDKIAELKTREGWDTFREDLVKTDPGARWRKRKRAATPA